MSHPDLRSPPPVDTVMLTLAAGLRRGQFDKMAHALGWPDTDNAARPYRRTKWRNPYRNYYVTEPDDADWVDAQAAGLARQKPAPFNEKDLVAWSVTPLGKAAVMLRLRAVMEAPRVG